MEMSGKMRDKDWLMLGLGLYGWMYLNRAAGYLGERGIFGVIQDTILGTAGPRVHIGPGDGVGELSLPSVPSFFTNPFAIIETILHPGSLLGLGGGGPTVGFEPWLTTPEAGFPGGVISPGDVGSGYPRTTWQDVIFP